MDAEGHARLAASGHRRYRYTVPPEVDARIRQQPSQRGIRARSRADAQALERPGVSRPDRQIGAQHQQPESMLGEGGQQFCALPSREGGQRRVGRAGHEVDLPVPQRFHSAAHREDHLQLHVDALGLEEPKLDGGNRREV